MGLYILAWFWYIVISNNLYDCGNIKKYDFFYR
jgi:hypothetical protein